MKQTYKSNSCKKSIFNPLTQNSTPISKKIKNSFTNTQLFKFISSGIKRKINFTSAFDYKGSKIFLKSKNIALQKILIEDNIENKKENKKDVNNCDINEFTPIRKNDRKILSSCKYLTPEEYIYKEKQNEKTISNKNKNNKKYMSKKNIFNYNVIDIDDELSENIKKKKSKKNFKIHELKMFKDNKIKSIEPIKISNYNKENDYYFDKKKF